ncbi:MAG TPA: DNA primase [Bacilli bacterium]|nr:DNA primase [Bacilli bacterium]
MNNMDKINEVRQANNIVDVISSYIPLVKKGKNYFGICPFHDDNNPSMSVSEEKQIYKCFSCGASGNVFNFIMEYEHIEFKEALELLARRAGVILDHISIKTTNKFDNFYDMYDIASKLYQNNLNTSLGAEARIYLEKRSISEDAIKYFKIGVSSKEQDSLVKILLTKKYSIKEMEALGLSLNNKDLFINRIMFPLFDLSGKVVGFSGRIYNSKSDSKYVNTKETVIFTKGEILYNYHNAKESVRKEKYLIVVEGFMDVIRLYISGIYNVIALMGTSLTKQQLSLIKKLSHKVYLSLDGDNPGKSANYNVGLMLEKEKIDLKVIELNNDYDPDSYIVEKGKDSYINLIDAAISFGEYKTKYLKKDVDFTNIDEKTKYINTVLEEINKESDTIKQELLLDKLSKDAELDVEILKNQLQKFKKYSKIETFEQVPVKIAKLDKYKKASYAIIYYMLNDYSVVKLYQKKLNFLPFVEERYLANEIIYYNKTIGEIELADFYTYLQDKPELKTVLDNVLQNDFAKLDDVNSVDDYFKVIEEYNCNLEIKRLKELMKKESDPLEKAKLADKIRLIKMGS